MTVGELKAVLADYADDLPVILSKDEEGNGFSPLAEVSDGIYVPNSTYSGEFIGTDESAFTADTRFAPPKPNAICLWPVN